MKPISKCTAKQLLSHIKDTIKDGDYDKWYVVIDEQMLSIDLVNPETMEIHGISAAAICYRAESRSPGNVDFY